MAMVLILLLSKYYFIACFSDLQILNLILFFVFFIHFFTGRRTGKCVQYYNYTFKTCEVQTWCPVEEHAAVR